MTTTEVINNLEEDIESLMNKNEDGNAKTNIMNFIRLCVNSEMGCDYNTNKPQLTEVQMNKLWKHIESDVSDGISKYLENWAYENRDSVSYWMESGEWE